MKTKSTHGSAPASASASLSMRQSFADWSCLRYGLVWAYEGGVLPASRNASATQNNYSCWLIRQGEVSVRTGRRSVTAGPGQWVFVARPSRHQHFSDDARILSVHFHCAWPGGEPLIEQQYSRIFDAALHPRLEREAMPIVRAVRRHFPRASSRLQTELCDLPVFLTVQNMLPRWLAAYVEAQAAFGVYPARLSAIDLRVREALAELDRHPLSQKFSEPEWVSRSTLGRSRLSALFTRATGMTPRRYYEQRRLDSARQLLEHTATSLKEIAADLGFQSASHFSHWWRKHSGDSPSALRKETKR